MKDLARVYGLESITNDYTLHYSFIISSLWLKAWKFVIFISSKITIFSDELLMRLYPPILLKEIRRDLHF